MTDTKNVILDVSLNLFSKKGFDGVSVREIAREVGVRESALYKHYKNKQEILNKIVEKMSAEIHATYTRLQVPETVGTNISEGYKKLSEEELYTLVWNIFQVFTGDRPLAKFRQLLIREQFHNPIFAECYNNFFLEGVIKSQSKTFLQLSKGGLFKNEAPEIIALHFYGPILFLFQEYDCCPEKHEEIKAKLFQHVRTFGKLYGKQD